MTSVDTQTLFDAIEFNDPTELQTILEASNVDVNVTNDEGWSLLHKATEPGCLECFTLLLQNPNVNVNIKGPNRVTPIFTAIKNNNIECLQLLLDHKDITVHIRNSDKRTPIFEAIKNNNIRCLKLLLDYKKINVNAQDKDGNTPLHLAARKGYIECAKLLLNHKNIDATLKNKNGKTALDIAKHSHHTDRDELISLLSPNNDSNNNSSESTSQNIRIPSPDSLSTHNNKESPDTIQPLRQEHNNIEDQESHIKDEFTKCIISRKHRVEELIKECPFSTKQTLTSYVKELNSFQEEIKCANFLDSTINQSLEKLYTLLRNVDQICAEIKQLPYNPTESETTINDLKELLSQLRYNFSSLLPSPLPSPLLSPSLKHTLPHYTPLFVSEIQRENQKLIQENKELQQKLSELQQEIQTLKQKMETFSVSPLPEPLISHQSSPRLSPSNKSYPEITEIACVFRTAFNVVVRGSWDEYRYQLALKNTGNGHFTLPLSDLPFIKDKQIYYFYFQMPPFFEERKCPDETPTFSYEPTLQCYYARFSNPYLTRIIFDKVNCTKISVCGSWDQLNTLYPLQSSTNSPFLSQPWHGTSIKGLG